MKDIADLISIQVLVDDFYTEVRKDAMLGPVFSAVIKGDWQPHLRQMYDFWNAALFGVPGFRGNPFIKHVPLPISASHFNRWLELFSQAIDRHFEGEVAEDAKKRAGLMAVMFQTKLQAARDVSKIVF
ncbi:group III truncated hemoglobin [Mucilaginibacter sp.]|uniref:group III truncated hemoglobin n=1 Tax=Mucilaginibacter sp. TaxID=1882438 RepID=UPI0035BC055B